MKTQDLPTDLYALVALRDCLTVVDDRYISAKSGEYEIRISWDTQEPDDHGWAVEMYAGGRSIDSGSLDTIGDLDNAISWLTE